MSFGLFLLVTLAEVSAVNVWAAVFGAATGGLGALLLADIGGAAASMAQRPGMASRWSLEVRRARPPMFYRLVGAAYIVVGVVMLVVGALGKIHVGRY